MKHRDRRKELGKMFMDISKYLATIGLASGLIRGELSAIMGFSIVVVVFLFAVIEFYTIPAKVEED